MVLMHYSVRENDPEKLEKIVLNPVKRSIHKLDRVVKIASTASHGVVDVGVGFHGNAAAQDLVAVTTRIEMLKFDENVTVLSRIIELRPPRLLLSDVETIYYIACDKDFPESYKTEFTGTKKEYDVFPDPIGKFQHMLNKTNLLKYLSLGIRRLGCSVLTDELLAMRLDLSEI